MMNRLTFLLAGPMAAMVALWGGGTIQAQVYDGRGGSCYTYWDNGFRFWPPPWYGKSYFPPNWPPPWYREAYLPPGWPWHPHPSSGCVMEAPPSPANELPPPRPLGKQARIQVIMPDPAGLLYVNQERTATRGANHEYVTVELEGGRSHVFRLRAAFRDGNDLLIEDRKVEVQAGATVQVEFKGTNALRVALPAESRQQLSGR